MLKKTSFYLRTFLFAAVLFTAIPVTYSQSAAKADAALEALNGLSDSQKESMVAMMLKSAPPEKRAALEETINAMKAVAPETATIDIKGKTVTFVSLAHASTSAFYAAVKKTIEDHKSNGYVIYYEQVKKDSLPAGDHVIDSIRLKFRKMMGAEPTRKSFAVLAKLFPDVVAQPAYSELGIAATDINADVSMRQLVEKYESLYGPVHLTACDFDTPTGTAVYPCDKLENDISPVVLDYRNKYVADLIKNSKDQKILVLFGAKHMKGMMDLIWSNQ